MLVKKLQATAKRRGPRGHAGTGTEPCALGWSSQDLATVTRAKPLLGCGKVAQGGWTCCISSEKPRGTWSWHWGNAATECTETLPRRSTRRPRCAGRPLPGTILRSVPPHSQAGSRGDPAGSLHPRQQGYSTGAAFALPSAPALSRPHQPAHPHPAECALPLLHPMPCVWVKNKIKIIIKK